MGLLDWLAKRRAKKKLGRFMRPDEEVEEFDVVEGPSGARVDLIATHRALYWVPIRSSDAIRIPYTNVLEVLGGSGFPGPTRIRTVSGNTFMYSPKRGDRGMADFVRRKIEGLTVASENFDVPGGDATVELRPLQEDDVPRWLMSVSPEVNPEDSDVQAEIDAVKERIAQKVGISVEAAQIPEGGLGKN